MKQHPAYFPIWTILGVLLAAGIGYGSAIAVRDHRIKKAQHFALNQVWPTYESGDLIEPLVPQNPEEVGYVQATDSSEPKTNTQPAEEPRKPTPPTCPPVDPEAPDTILFPLSPTVGIGPARPQALSLIASKRVVPNRTFCLLPAANDAFEAMAAAAQKDNVRLIVVSAYRTSGRQKELVAQGEGGDGEHSSIALPGHSEHQLGTALDLTSGTVPVMTFYRFDESPEYAWLQEHAADYGFVQSFQENQEDITGYVAEPWHWRYVGPEHAQAIVDEGVAPVTYLTNMALKWQKGN